MPTLSLYFGLDFADEDWRGLTYQLDCPGGKRGGEWILGRAPTSDLRISIRNVSRRHAAIAYSYAADRWSIQDLGSSEGTFLNGRLLPPGDLQPLKIGDRFYLADNLLNVVEDEQDTVGGDSGPPTIASTEPLDYRPVEPPAPTPAPAPPRTYADTAFYAVQWLFSGSTVLGKVYRVVMLAGATAFVVALVDLAQR
ncbi:FHA domain-containing protein [Nodosilinea sp. LEGE 06152]|uniref:FHA domain-containing protein n=1 Tax=Nodosilinea sp. LEGE 06152 TaxID=2777966 RepID=UPI00187FCD4B|nr:FHA domain-containing protein [Nodosilinea sp. LEGE 06152]MBE9159726.1 FHA domain-containing protein [Nodosilinea sp. LEGE 06152]